MRIAVHRSPSSAWYPWSQEWHSTTYRTADPEREALKARDGGDDVSPRSWAADGPALLPAFPVQPHYRRWLRQAARKTPALSLLVREGDSRAVAGVLDSAV